MGSSLGEKVSAILIVADGHGPVGEGEAASALVVQTISARFREILSGEGYPDAPWLERAAAHCIHRANLAVRATRSETAKKEEVGATCTVAIIGGDSLVVGSVGDSRVYLVRRGALSQITNDHSIIRQGEGGLGAYLSRAIGWEPTVEPECSTTSLSPGDIILLCSDGLNRMLSDSDMMQVIARSEDPQSIAERLVATTNKRGGFDNVSVIVAQFGVATAATKPTGGFRRLLPNRRRVHDR